MLLVLLVVVVVVLLLVVLRRGTTVLPLLPLWLLLSIRPLLLLILPPLLLLWLLLSTRPLLLLLLSILPFLPLPWPAASIPALKPLRNDEGVGIRQLRRSH